MRKTYRNLWIAWLASLATIIVLSWVSRALDAAGLTFPPIGLVDFLAKLAFIGLTLYWIAAAIALLLRKLFWRVGRRLALSYFLIGVLPFILFAILVTTMGYALAGVLSQAAYRAERQGYLNRMDQWNLEFALAGRKPVAALPTLEVAEVREGSTTKLPAWLTAQTFSGLVRRGNETVLVSSRIYGDGSQRSVIFVQPLDATWVKALEAKNGMVVSYSNARQKSSDRRDLRSEAADGQTSEGDGGKGLKIQKNDGTTIDTDVDDTVFASFFSRAVRLNGVMWGDVSPPLVSWETGESEENRKLFTLIWNPWSNLLDYYFGSSEYAQATFGVIGGIAVLLLLIYLPATLLAAALIFAISRAVNRIEKGTRAVERGDFSYRIGMKPRNQLGQMAVSFDRMTESITSLLVKAAEKERLQSEIAIAASIQRNLLPKEGPQFGGVSFSAHFEPTASIGGDYYDVFNLDHARLAVAIGDVSGHGLSTGLVMAMVKAAITTLVEEGADEVSMFRRLNDLVFRSTEKRAFMTLGFTIFDLERGTVRHTNAGHLYPYLLRAEQPPFAIECPSLPLGVRRDVESQTSELSLCEGDCVVYLSDGIVEAQDHRGDPFGFDHLESILERVKHDSPAEIQTAILQAIEAHAGGRDADDDRTVMVLRFDKLPGLTGRAAHDEQAGVPRIENPENGGAQNVER